MMKSTFPDHEWVPWRFKRHRAWGDMKNRRSFFDSIAKDLNVQKLEDWYQVDKNEVSKLGGGYLLNHYYKDSLKNALKVRGFDFILLHGQCLDDDHFE
jgi:hypothetical protein